MTIHKQPEYCQNIVKHINLEKNSLCNGALYLLFLILCVITMNASGQSASTEKK